MYEHTKNIHSEIEDILNEKLFSSRTSIIDEV
jgi:hypothetical protein